MTQGTPSTAIKKKKRKFIKKKRKNFEPLGVTICGKATKWSLLKKKK
jgi:hypothetical protein